jgi:formylmethanofuran dehydrogenase subunit E
MKELQAYLSASAARHSHLCPRQVLGVRTGLAGKAALGMEATRTDKRMLVILETDGCFADGVEVSTGTTIGRRTLRVEDYGKIAATFVDTANEQAVRVVPRPDVRDRAWEYAPQLEKRQYYVQLYAYQVMPEEVLFDLRTVKLVKPVAEIISQPELRARCTLCREEIINGRETHSNDKVFCRACAGQSYYSLTTPPLPLLASSPTAAKSER